MMKFNWILILRAHQFALAFITLGLSAYVVNWYVMQTMTQSPSQVNFMVAAPLFSLLSIAYTEITSRFVKKLYHPYVAFGCDVFNAIMYFSGFIAMATFLNSLLFCRGEVCGAARADTVFAAFSWVTWTGSAVLVGLATFRKNATSPNPRTEGMFTTDKVNVGQA